MEQKELPLGFGMALAQRPDAMQRYSALSKQEKAEILRRVHSAESKNEMQAIVSSLDTSG